MDAVRSAPELYAHAIAIEREATERYGELASRMKELGNPAVAELFGKLGAMEAEHLQTLERRTDGVPIPPLRLDQYRWLDAGAPETAARELVYRLMTPRAALQIALEAEKRAQAFFEYVYGAAADPALHALAKEMALEEKEHVAMVERLLESTPDGNVDWTVLYRRGERRERAP